MGSSLNSKCSVRGMMKGRLVFGVKVQISTLVVYIFVTLCNFTLKLQNVVI